MQYPRAREFTIFHAAEAYCASREAFETRAFRHRGERSSRPPPPLPVEISRQLSTWINFSSRVINYRVSSRRTRYLSPGEIARLRVYERFTVLPGGNI